METQGKSTLKAEDVLKAYTMGYFPMSEARDDPEVFWVLPDLRGTLPLDGFHLSRSLRKLIKQDRFDIRVNSDFKQTMLLCAERTELRDETWINDQIIDIYSEIHEMGGAHSIETWQDGKMVGGLYGICIAGAFFGESMFSRVTNASKVALVALVARLRQGQFLLLDTQFMTSHLASFGAVEMDRGEYQANLDLALRAKADFFKMPLQTSGSTILQSMTQRS